MCNRGGGGVIEGEKAGYAEGRESEGTKLGCFAGLNRLHGLSPNTTILARSFPLIFHLFLSLCWSHSESLHASLVRNVWSASVCMWKGS